ncbi:MAG: hypothetical protein JNK02_07295 [Planctomycetes bacterium]|nr:hypothetical protein [Planctomycetota bacterium]
MVQINFAQKQVNAKIVYYGPGMSGKTTNLEIVHQRAPAPNRGDLTSISTDGDRTLFFDFMPLDLGTVAGMRTCFQLYTVPGQVYYNSTRKLVLQGVDGVVFVADSSASMVEENLESMRNLEQNLSEYGKSLASIPLIIQYNKRDLPDALPVEELQRLLNPYGAPCFEAIANTGQGVFPTLKALAARVLESIHTGAKQPAAPAAGIQAGLSQTGFHPAPAVGQGTPAAPRPLGQTGYHPAASVPLGAPQPAPTAGPHGAGAPRTIGMQPGLALHGGAPVHGGAPQPMAHPGQAIPMGHPQPQVQAPLHPQVHAAPAAGQHGLHVPGPIPHQPQPALHQTGYGYAPQPGMQPGMHHGMQPAMQHGMQPAIQHGMQPGMQHAVPMQAAPAAVLAQQPAAAQGPIGMMRVERSGGAAAAQKPRAGAPKAAGTAPARPGTKPAAKTATPAEAGPRIQPRNQPMPTPGSGKKRLVYTAVFLVVALGVGAVVAKMVLSVL